MTKDKPFGISKWAVLKAWERVRANQGAAGVDDVSVSEFEKKLKNNLYRIWNRMVPNKLRQIAWINPVLYRTGVRAMPLARLRE
jgi:retron-type reverse transcriptase